MLTTIFHHLMLGPLLLVLAFLFKQFPPQKINYWYGYRTPRSMKSQMAWEFANRFSANAVVFVSGVTCLVQLITFLLLESTASISWSAGFLVVSLVAVIPLTEIALKKKGFV